MWPSREPFVGESKIVNRAPFLSSLISRGFEGSAILSEIDDKARGCNDGYSDERLRSISSFLRRGYKLGGDGYKDEKESGEEDEARDDEDLKDGDEEVEREKEEEEEEDPYALPSTDKIKGSVNSYCFAMETPGMGRKALFF